MVIIDCRGLQCPAPVVKTKKAFEESGGQGFSVIVDNGAAFENVFRFCNSKGCNISLEKGESTTSINISASSSEVCKNDINCELEAPVILIASDRLGNGEDELGRLLLKNFIITLLEVNHLPSKIIFVNSGVLLTSKDSECIEPLQKLSTNGVEILSCGVCLDYYGTRESLAIGNITNMYTIAESILSSRNMIRL